MKILENSAAGFNFVVLPLRIPKNDRVEIEVKAVNSKEEILDHIRKSILVEVKNTTTLMVIITVSFYRSNIV